MSGIALTCPLCGAGGDEVFFVADVWHCDECQASGEIAIDGGSGELRLPDAENSSRTRVVRHLARTLTYAHGVPPEQSERLVRFVLDYVKWGLPRQT